MRQRWFCLTVLALLLHTGCGTSLAFVSRADRDLLHQTGEAGRFVAANATDPEVVQAGQDVAANTQVLQATVIGPPVAPQPYSPQRSAAARQAATEAQDDFDGAVGGYLSWGITALGLGTLAPALVVLWRRRKQIEAFAMAFSRIRGHLANGGIDEAGAVEELERTNEEFGVYEATRKDYKRLKKKGRIAASARPQSRAPRSRRKKVPA